MLHRYPAVRESIAKLTHEEGVDFLLDAELIIYENFALILILSPKN